MSKKIDTGYVSPHDPAYQSVRRLVEIEVHDTEAGAELRRCAESQVLPIDVVVAIDKFNDLPVVMDGYYDQVDTHLNRIREAIQEGRLNELDDSDFFMPDVHRFIRRASGSPGSHYDGALMGGEFYEQVVNALVIEQFEKREGL